jgi:hypothetical protein
MGRYATFPITIEDCFTISCKNLKDWGYLTPNTYCRRTTTVTYGRADGEGSSIGLVICNTATQSYIEFNYTIRPNEEAPIKISYRVPLVKVPTNIGDSYRFYFLCPHTGKRCSKLYKPPQEHYFLHRASFPYLFYQNQLQSKQERLFYNHSELGLEIKIDNLYYELGKKYKKRHYRGKPTPLVKKLNTLLEQYS